MGQDRVFAHSSVNWAVLHLSLSIQIIQNVCLYTQSYGKESVTESKRVNKSNGSRYSVIDDLIHIAIFNVLWYLFALWRFSVYVGAESVTSEILNSIHINIKCISD